MSDVNCLNVRYQLTRCQLSRNVNCLSDFHPLRIWFVILSLLVWIIILPLLFFAINPKIACTCLHNLSRACVDSYRGIRKPSKSCRTRPRIELISGLSSPCKVMYIKPYSLICYSQRESIQHINTTFTCHRYLICLVSSSCICLSVSRTGPKHSRLWKL